MSLPSKPLKNSLFVMCTSSRQSKTHHPILAVTGKPAVAARFHVAKKPVVMWVMPVPVPLRCRAGAALVKIVIIGMHRHGQHECRD